LAAAVALAVAVIQHHQPAPAAISSWQLPFCSCSNCPDQSDNKGNSLQIESMMILFAYTWLQRVLVDDR